MPRFVRDAIVTLLLSGAAAAAVGIAVLSGGGAGANHEPIRIEEVLANQALHFSIPGASGGMQNPHANDTQTWRDGSPIFAGRCSVCHDADGHGHTDLASRMYPRVPDLGGARVQAFSDGQLFWIIQSGIRLTGMPGFHGLVTDDDTWKLVSFVRRVPSLTSADLQASHERAASGTTITMDGTRFHPDDLTVPAGTTVTFTNEDFFPHNVQSESGHLHSGSLDPDQSWSVRLDQAGTFTYVCTLHPGMKGVLHVR